MGKKNYCTNPAGWVIRTPLPGNIQKFNALVPENNLYVPPSPFSLSSLPMGKSSTKLMIFLLI